MNPLHKEVRQGILKNAAASQVTYQEFSDKQRNKMTVEKRRINITKNLKEDNDRAADLPVRKSARLSVKSINSSPKN